MLSDTVRASLEELHGYELAGKKQANFLVYVTGFAACTSIELTGTPTPICAGRPNNRCTLYYLLGTHDRPNIWMCTTGSRTVK